MHGDGGERRGDRTKRHCRSATSEKSYERGRKRLRASATGWPSVWFERWVGARRVLLWNWFSSSHLAPRQEASWPAGMLRPVAGSAPRGTLLPSCRIWLLMRCVAILTARRCRTGSVCILPRACLRNKLVGRRWRNLLGQGDRGGGGPAGHAAEGNAGPAGFYSGMRA